jgi:hypothetical protein
MKTRFHDRADKIIGVEIWGVKVVVDEDDMSISYEEDNEDPDAYGVYLRVKEDDVGLVEHVGDFPTIELAEFMANAITLTLDVPITNKAVKE